MKYDKFRQSNHTNTQSSNMIAILAFQQIPILSIHRKHKKQVWIKITIFFNDAFHSYYDLFQVNSFVQT